MDTRTIGPLCVPLGLGFDFPERWQANLGWGGMVCNLFNIYHQAAIPSIVLGAGDTAVQKKDPVRHHTELNHQCQAVEGRGRTQEGRAPVRST